MSKNHSDLRDALFESSEYLADVLTQCAFIEKNFYHNSNFVFLNSVLILSSLKAL
jgi:hypothetical protein